MSPWPCALFVILTIWKYLSWTELEMVTHLKHVSFYFKSTLYFISKPLSIFYFNPLSIFDFKSTLNILFQIHSQIWFQIHSGVFIWKVNCSSPRWSFTWQLSQILSQKCKCKMYVEKNDKYLPGEVSPRSLDRRIALSANIPFFKKSTF